MDYLDKISSCLNLLKRQEKASLGEVSSGILQDHFMSLKNGLKIFATFLEVSENKDLIMYIRFVVASMNFRLHALEIECSITNLDHAYTDLRRLMKLVIMKPGTDDDFNMLFPETFKQWHCFNKTRNFLLKKIRKLITSDCKTDQIIPVMKELEYIRQMLTSLGPFFDYVMTHRFLMGKDEEIFLDALATFFENATCLIYSSFVGNLHEGMLVSVRKNFSSLIEETKIKEMSLACGIICEGTGSEIDIALSLLKRQEAYQTCTINEAVFKDHIMRLKHGFEFLKWLPQIYIDRDLERRITLLAENVKQKLESLTYEQGDDSLNMDVNGAYADLREEMKNVIINPATNKYDTLFPEFSRSIYYYRGYNNFLLEKITTLVTTNYKVEQIDPLKKELQNLKKMLTSLKPLWFYIECRLWSDNGEKYLTTLFTFYKKVTCLTYLSFVGKMDIEMVLSLKCNIETTVEETDVWEIYTVVLNVEPKMTHCLEEELYLLKNLVLLLKSNAESFNDASSKLYEVLIDIHSFLLGIYPNVLLRKLHLLQPSFQAILGHLIPIVYSCYLEHTGVDISSELNCVLDLIKHIKSEAQEIKLYYYPRIDEFGFLEFFLGYLEDLMKNPEISVKELIDSLHFEVHSLLSLAKVTNQEKLYGTPWTDIINLAYQAEYIIDLYLVSCFRDLRLISSLSKIIEQLKNIRVDVHGVCCESLPAQNVAGTSKLQVPPMTTQVNDGDAIVGLQEEARIITEYLLKGDNKLDVISIVGMAGIGKTTLALSIFKTPSIADHFDILAWCTVSQSYQIRDLLVSILEQVNAFDKDHRSRLDDQELNDHLSRSLKKRRYLIILDDVWDTTAWNDLKRYLPDDREGSRIVITTRIRNVSHQISSKVNELQGLSKENSWRLFQKKMFEIESLSDDLLEISKTIIEHCKGLPLSIVIIAGILSNTTRTEKNWTQIAESVSSLILKDPQGKCKAILELSYNHLPNHLRSCFLYMASFAEDQEISVDRLISLWIAEGLVRDTNSNNAEELAKKYMEDLIVKSLVIPSQDRSRGGVKTFRIHDLLLDFCLDKAKEKHFFTLLDKRDYSRPLQDPRRLIINGPYINDLHFSCHSVRSMILRYGDLEASEIEKRIQSCDMVLLKVLEVGSVSSTIFPDISSLVHLRYLALGLWNWKSLVLPLSISKLQNLQILILRCLHDVIKVPDYIFDMIKLRHVHISYQASFEVDSNRVQNSSFLLENLRSLSNARVSGGDSKWLSKLSGLERVSCVFVDGYSKDNQFRMLSFNSHLTSLKVESKSNFKYRFIRTCQLSKSLRELALSKFSLRSNDISEIGSTLPNLEVFKIYSCYVLSGYEWNVNDKDFPALKVLKLRNLEISKWIVSENSFPSLEQLWVEKCCSLDEISLDFGYLLKLRLISVRECAPSVDDSARKIEEMQHEEQNTEMRIRIYPKK